MSRLDRRCILSLALGVLAAGCGGSGRPYAPDAINGTEATPTPSPTPSPTPGGVAPDAIRLPDFSVHVDFATYSFDETGTLAIPIEVRGTPELATPITLSLYDATDGVTATFAPAIVTPGGGKVLVTATVRTTRLAEFAQVSFKGVSGALQRTTSSVTIAAARKPVEVVALQSGGFEVGERNKTFAVALTQYRGSGPVSLSVSRSDLTSGSTNLPLPESATISGLPGSVDFAGGQTNSEPLELLITLPAGAASGIYGFAILATRDGVQDKAVVTFTYQTRSLG